MYIPIYLSGHGELMKLKCRKSDSQRTLALNKDETQKFMPDSESNLTQKQQVEVDQAQLKDIVRENVKTLLTTIFPITCEGLTAE